MLKYLLDGFCLGGRVTSGDILTSSGDGSRFALASWLDGDGNSKSSFLVRGWLKKLIPFKDLEQIKLCKIKNPNYIFLCVSGVLGLGEFNLSINLGTEDVVDMLSPVSSVSPVLWLSNVDIDARCFSLRFSFFFFFSFFFCKLKI